MPVTSILKTSTLVVTIKVKLNATGNEICLEVFEDVDNKKYLKHLMTLQHLQATKGMEKKLLIASRELVNKNKILNALCKLHTLVTCEAKELCLMEIPKAKSQLID
jgi:hypothetical protein